MRERHGWGSCHAALCHTLFDHKRADRIKRYDHFISMFSGPLSSRHVQYYEYSSPADDTTSLANKGSSMNLQ